MVLPDKLFKGAGGIRAAGIQFRHLLAMLLSQVQPTMLLRHFPVAREEVDIAVVLKTASTASTSTAHTECLISSHMASNWGLGLSAVTTIRIVFLRSKGAPRCHVPAPDDNSQL